MTQLTLDAELQARDAAIMVAGQAAPESWKQAAWDEICRLAATGTVFSANDVNANIGALDSHQQAMGGLFRRARRQSIIRGAGSGQSERPGGHLGHIRLWRGERS